MLSGSRKLETGGAKTLGYANGKIRERNARHRPSSGRDQSFWIAWWSGDLDGPGHAKRPGSRGNRSHRYRRCPYPEEDLTPSAVHIGEPEDDAPHSSARRKREDLAEICGWGREQGAYDQGSKPKLEPCRTLAEAVRVVMPVVVGEATEPGGEVATPDPMHRTRCRSNRLEEVAGARATPAIGECSAGTEFKRCRRVLLRK